MNRKTQAQRDAINKRAREYPRPISARQIEALRYMVKVPLRRGRAGWATDPPLIKYWQSQTIHALVGCGLCRLAYQRPRGSECGRTAMFAIITAAGKRELERHPSDGYAWAHQ